MNEGIPLPNFLDRDAWLGFCAMRDGKGKRTPFTLRAAQLVLKTLQQLKEAGHDPNAALDQSTLNGWSDVYMPKTKEISVNRSTDADVTRDYLDSQKPPEATPEGRERVSRMLQETRMKLVGGAT